ncbi:MAG: hypothetical protein ACJ8DO_20225 [Microvirga sp.]
MDRNPEPANGRPTPPKDRNPEKPSGSSGELTSELPPAGPHADPALTNPDATPGAGTLTPAGGHDEVDSTSG